MENTAKTPDEIFRETEEKEATYKVEGAPEEIQNLEIYMDSVGLDWVRD